MKSREGTVVDADDLMDEMIATARQMAEELGKLEGIPDDEKEEIIRKIGLGALKYFILKVDPRKNMTFNPRESIDFNGNTGPFIQYTFARIQSVLRKAGEKKIGGTETDINTDAIGLKNKEKELIRMIYRFRATLEEAGKTLSPALIANYVYELVKTYNQFYHEHPILAEPDEQHRALRLKISSVTGLLLEESMRMLGIEMAARM